MRYDEKMENTSFFIAFVVIFEESTTQKPTPQNMADIYLAIGIPCVSYAAFVLCLAVAVQKEWV